MYKNFFSSLKEQPEVWITLRFKDIDGNYPIPKKENNVKRILYLSNSHGLTGGKVSTHLQKLLDLVYPTEYELVDLSSGGMFAPEFVQRFSAALNYDIDYAILPLSYIAFSDRMGLSHQAATAHSMFHSDVIKTLPFSFWYLNYDLGLYLNKLGERIVDLYRFKNELRHSWEDPALSYLKSIDNKPIFFLRSKHNIGWRFPKGFKNNLFQWSLYSLGRKSHLGNIKSLVSMANENDVKIISANLPIHWDKEPIDRDENDIQQYRAELKSILETETTYSDYQDVFPVEFSTYDALHPTWYGARLHALDFLLKLNKLRKIPKTEKEIYQVYLKSDVALSGDYITALNGDYPPLKKMSFRRYDVSEPDNARILLQRVNSLPLGSQSEHQHLHQLALRLDFWERSDFKQNDQTLWGRTVNKEIDNFLIRVKKFKQELVSIQKKKISKLNIPDLANLTFIQSGEVKVSNGILLTTKLYVDHTKNRYTTFALADEDNPFAFRISSKKLGNFILYDILRDNSFILYYSDSSSPIPSMLLTDTIKVDFGI